MNKKRKHRAGGEDVEGRKGRGKKTQVRGGRNQNQITRSVFKLLANVRSHSDNMIAYISAAFGSRAYYLSSQKKDIPSNAGGTKVSA